MYIVSSKKLYFNHCLPKKNKKKNRYTFISLRCLNENRVLKITIGRNEHIKVNILRKIRKIEHVRNCFFQNCAMSLKDTQTLSCSYKFLFSTRIKVKEKKKQRKINQSSMKI